MRPVSNHSRNVIESIREEKGEKQFASAPHSQPNVGFPQEGNAATSLDTSPPPPDHGVPDTRHNSATGDTAADETDDIATLHQQHSRQIDALGRERNELARKLAEITRDLAEARKEHEEEMERMRLERDAIIKEREALGLQLAQAREHRRQQAETFASDCTQLLTERDHLSAQLADGRTRHQAEMETLNRDHDEISTTLAREREQRHREVATLSEQKDTLTRERNDLSAELDRTREGWRQEAETLTAERDALRSERDSLAAVSAETSDQHKTHLADFERQHDAVVRERYRISSEFSSFRQAHDTAVESLAAERDQLRNGQSELRQHLEVVKQGHRQELEELRREHSAVLKECDEMRALLESDRLAWSKQIELFTSEREALSREREEALAELAHERQVEDRQVGLRSQENAALVAQRKELLGQIEALRATEQRQNTLFHEERQILCEERDHTAEKLARSMDALGEERVTLLEQKTDAESRYEAEKQAHASEVAALEEARVAMARERDAALRELAVFQDAEAREQSSFGTTVSRKFELASEMARDGLRMECDAKDATLSRNVAIRMIHGGATSEERRAELIEEARHLAQLQHPSIPPIYEAGFDDAGRIFYTTRAVTGMNLRDVLDELERGKTSSLLHFGLRRLLSVFHRVCDALAYAHSREIAHGDLKPDHILLGEFGEVFVTGWRLPRTADADGQPLPAFRPREDINALGRILYEMTNLIRPPSADATAEEIGKHGKKKGAERAWAGDKDVNAIAGIARRALDPKAAGRFFSVRELQMQVDAFKDSFDDPARVTLKTIVRQWTYHHRVALIVTGVLLVLALGAGVWWRMQPRLGEAGPAFRSENRMELPAPVRPAK